MTPKLLGTVDHPAGEVHLARTYSVPAARVWEALTEPSRLSDWLAAVESGAPGPGATFVLRLNDAETATCTVLDWDPPRALRLRWDYTGEGVSELSLELTDDADGGTRLALHHVRLPVDAVQYGAGWHVHLDNLAVHLDGRAVSSEGCCGAAFLAAWEELAPRYAAT